MPNLNLVVPSVIASWPYLSQWCRHVLPSLTGHLGPRRLVAIGILFRIDLRVPVYIEIREIGRLVVEYKGQVGKRRDPKCWCIRRRACHWFHEKKDKENGKKETRKKRKTPEHTKSGSHSPSQVPNNWSLAVPETIKSFAKSIQPILSKPHINGLPVVWLIPAMTGVTKNGPNRFSYKLVETRLAIVWGEIDRSSRSRYMLTLYRNRSDTVATSVARPVSPKNTSSPYLKILGKLLDTVRACMPSRRSHAMATQPLPTMATQAPPSVEREERE